MSIFPVLKKIPVLILVFCGCLTYSQSKKYSSSNAHSHNDYEQARPLREASDQQFGSIEADIFLINGELIVAHHLNETANRRKLDSLYLYPLSAAIKANNGRVYKDAPLQIMIDIKTQADSTLRLLITELQGFPLLQNTPGFKILISGNRPDPLKFNQYPDYISFDGELNKDYSPEALKKIEMMSDNFRRYSDWKGVGDIPAADREKLVAAIAKSHALNKKVRFWNAPDNESSWRLLMGLGADFINTDKIGQLAAFLKK